MGDLWVIYGDSRFRVSWCKTKRDISCVSDVFSSGFISFLSCVFWSCWVYVGMLETLRCLPPVKAKMAQREPAAPTTNSIQLSVPGKPHRSDIVTWLRIHLELFRYLRQEDLAQKNA